jgi:5'-3' exonuclease
MGDTSDNIPSAFPKCGEKTALKCCQDNNFFLKKMNNNEEYYKQYELNKKLVDFNNIPQNLVDEFLSNLAIK